MANSCAGTTPACDHQEVLLHWKEISEKHKVSPDTILTNSLKARLREGPGTALFKDSLNSQGSKTICKVQLQSDKGKQQATTTYCRSSAVKGKLLFSHIAVLLISCNAIHFQFPNVHFICLITLFTMRKYTYIFCFNQKQTFMASFIRFWLDIKIQNGDCVCVHKEEEWVWTTV